MLTVSLALLLAGAPPADRGMAAAPPPGPGVTEVQVARKGDLDMSSNVVPLAFAPRDYLADLRSHLSRYQLDMDREAGSGDASVYYRTSYYLHGILGAAEASGDPLWMDRLVDLEERMVVRARPLVRGGVTYQEWGPWDANGNPPQLDTFQALGALARTAAVIARQPAYRNRYRAQGQRIAAFVDQAVFGYWFDKTRGVYKDPGGSRLGGQVPWLPVSLGGWGSYPDWNDKCSHFGMIATWMYQATGKPIYKEYAQRVAKAFRGHLQESEGCLIWDLGRLRGQGSPDTSHANREAMMLVAFHEAGIDFSLAEIRKVAATLTRRIWNRDLDRPRFANFIDGGNGPFGGLGPGQNGNVYLGWAMLGRYSAQAQQILATVYHRVQQDGSDPAQAQNATPYARVQFAGTLARNLTCPANPRKDSTPLEVTR